jgi:hypothetical protein
MIEEAAALAGPAGRVALLAPMPAEFGAVAPKPALVPGLAEGAIAAMDKGDLDGHDLAASRRRTARADTIALGEFSQLARAREAVAEVIRRTVLATPDARCGKCNACY